MPLGTTVLSMVKPVNNFYQFFAWMQSKIILNFAHEKQEDFSVFFFFFLAVLTLKTWRLGKLFIFRAFRCLVLVNLFFNYKTSIPKNDINWNCYKGNSLCIFLDRFLEYLILWINTCVQVYLHKWSHWAPWACLHVWL